MQGRVGEEALVFACSAENLRNVRPLLQKDELLIAKLRNAHAILGGEGVLGRTCHDKLIEDERHKGVFVGIKQVHAYEGEIDLVAIQFVDQVFLATFEVVHLNRGVACPIGAEGVREAVFLRQGERADAQGVRGSLAIHLETVDGAMIFRKHLAHI